MSIKKYYEKHPKLVITIVVFFGLILVYGVMMNSESEAPSKTTYESYDKNKLVQCKEGNYGLIEQNEEDSHLEILDKQYTCELLLHKKNGSTVRKEYCSWGCIYQLEDEWITDLDRQYRQCCIKSK